MKKIRFKKLFKGKFGNQLTKANLKYIFVKKFEPPLSWTLQYVKLQQLLNTNYRQLQF